MKIDLSHFDPYQLEIINENSGRDIVVGASAGAGKTTGFLPSRLPRQLPKK